MKIKTTEIIYREDLYPRFEPNQVMIQRYSESIEHLPSIKLDQHKILIDGFHRWKAFMLAGVDEIPYETVIVESEKELKKLSYQYNSNHGIQLTNEEKKKYAIEMIEDCSIDELKAILSVSRQSIEGWTKNKREDLEKERNRKIIETYLRAWKENTQEKIGEEYKVDKSTINRILLQIPKISEMQQNFSPLLYNIWNTQKGNETDHFGSFPKVFMDNLLYYHTEPLDIVFDPFAGNGTTVDSCKDFFRRYCCSDRIVKPGREKDIIKHDITTGFPENLSKPQLIFLDPPYWILANKEYSEDETDLGNMTKDKFYETMKMIVDESKKRKIERIAYLIRPIWETGNEKWEWVDPMFDLYDMLSDKYRIEMRYVIPYSTQQYSALWVDRTKEKKQCLILNRELTIFKLR